MVRREASVRIDLHVVIPDQKKVDDGNDNDEEEGALAVLVLHRVVDVPPALQSEFVSQLRPPVSALDHCLHLQNTNDIKTSNIKKKEIYST